MINKKIELNILFFIIIQALFFLFFLKNSLTNIIISAILGSIIIFLFNKLKLTNRQIIKWLLLIILLYSSTIVLHQITHFIEYNILQNFPLIIISITLIFMALFLAFRGYHSYIKSMEIMAYLIAFISLLSIGLSLYNINIHNFNQQLIQEVTINQAIIPMTSSIVIIYLAINYLNNYTINLKTYFISLGNIIITKLLCLAILGETLFNLYQYPYISILKRIKYLDFIERMEGILSFQYLFYFFFLLTLIYLVIKFLLTDLLKLKKDKIINLTLSIMIIITLIIIQFIP